MLEKDKNGKYVQMFAPSRIVSVLADTEWKPEENDIAFCVPVTCQYSIGDDATLGTLQAGAERVICEDYTFTFNTAMNIEVM
jgi:hypothetical protein